MRIENVPSILGMYMNCELCVYVWCGTTRIYQLLVFDAPVLHTKNRRLNLISRCSRTCDCISIWISSEKYFFFCLIFWINQIYLITFMDHSKISDPFRLCLCIIRIFFLIFYLILALHPHTYAFGTVTDTHSPMRWDSFGTRMPCAEYAVLRLFFDWRSLLRGSSQSFGIGWMVWRRRRATIRLKKNKNLCVHPYVTVQSLVNASSKCISHTHPSATRARPCVCVRLPRVFIVFELYAMAWLFDTICRIRFTLLL